MRVVDKGDGRRLYFLLPVGDRLLGVCPDDGRGKRGPLPGPIREVVLKCRVDGQEGRVHRDEKLERERLERERTKE